MYDGVEKLSDYLVSIIIPFFNAKVYLMQMLQCVKWQTFENYEVIMVDDGSCDGSAIIAKQYTVQDSRFHYIYQKKQGVSAARNNGLRHARGEWITFLDADDRIPPDYLKTLLSCSAEADIVVCDVCIEKSGKKGQVFSFGANSITSLDAINAILVRRTINSGPYAKLFKRNTIQELEFPAMKTYEDIIFVMQSFENAKIIVSTDKTEYVYVQNDSGAMGKMLKTPSLDIVLATDFIMQYIINHKEVDQECCYATLSHLYQYAYPLALQKGVDSSWIFVNAASKLFKRYMKQILRCTAFPWKEKILFWLYSNGFVIDHKKILRIESVK